ncbi:hypothetical protein N7G274_007420 [Stereocaulon virgatum]|uniref:Uncharacterized protein n=1 Tax=Stereocaulon virgatum TaxID=373712 RepID=A0ABR4A240_9LECA
MIVDGGSARVRLAFAAIASLFLHFDVLHHGKRDHLPQSSRNNADSSSVLPSLAEISGETTEHERPAATLTAKTQVNKESVVTVTGSTGTEGFLGIPNLTEMVYENRRTYQQMGL